MHNRWKGLIGQTLVILVVGHVVSNASTAGQISQDQDTRTQAGQPPSLQRKRQCLEAQLQKWQQEGKNLQPIGEILQDFPPLFEQQKFAEAELVVDRALKVTGGTCSQEPTSPLPGTAPSTQSDPPPSLQGKMERLQALVQQKQDDEANLQPFMEVMQGLGPLMQQHKFSEAEALMDRALKVLAEAAPEKSSSIGPPLIAYGARDADVRQQIFVVHPDSTGKRRLSQEGKQNSSPAWSPDGRKMAFTSDRSSSVQIWVMKADGTRPRQLTTEGENSVPAWAPDGKRLAFGSNRTGHYEIWAMDSDGTHQKQLTTTDAAVGNNGPTWSPDGRRIAFYSTQSGHSAIWVMDQDGGHLTQLTTPFGDRFPDSNAPAWSPDGAKIAFWSGRAHGDGNVWVMDADGSNRR